ncbi:hypothetical protein [Thiorhodovibrio frisius]|uniref:hypothetical protein n=1 Tax=Thiorhodovibrio frisius TaxID=631362 RepID=UPI00022C73DC|nr:hypothetical protein [Thiorhodovibrio frisius]
MVIAVVEALGTGFATASQVELVEIIADESGSTIPEARGGGFRKADHDLAGQMTDPLTLPSQPQAIPTAVHKNRRRTFRSDTLLKRGERDGAALLRRGAMVRVNQLGNIPESLIGNDQASGQPEADAQALKISLTSNVPVISGTRTISEDNGIALNIPSAEPQFSGKQEATDPITVAESGTAVRDHGEAVDKEQIEVIAGGVGIDQAGALKNAYSNAIQQALGVYVDAEMLVQNSDLVKDEVLTHSRGLIKKVDILDESVADGLHHVRIRALVLKQPLLEKVTPILKTTARVDGVSIHSQVVSKDQAQADAAALLAEVLKPFIGPTLFVFELGGDIKSKEGAKDTLIIPIRVRPNLEAYDAAVKKFQVVADQISSSKKPHLYESDGINRPNPDYGCDTININTWRSSNFKQTKWVSYAFDFPWHKKNRGFYSPYTVDESVIAESVFENLLEKELWVTLLDKENQEIGMTSVSVDERFSALNDNRWCNIYPGLFQLKPAHDYVLEAEMPLQTDEIEQIKNVRIELMDK